MNSLAALDADERRARLRAFRAFKMKVFFASIFGKRHGAKRTADTPKVPEGGHIYTND